MRRRRKSNQNNNEKIIQNLSSNMKTNGFMFWLQKVSFQKIFFMWILIILLFGFTFYFCQGRNSYLLNTSIHERVTSLSDCLYYSFVASTTTGFGDIVPFGFFKFITVIEVIPGLLLLALVTSKIVSIKQDVILSELYEISLFEKVNKLRTSLLLFRRNLSNVISDAEEKTLARTRINDLEMNFMNFENLLDEIRFFISKSRTNSYIKRLDSVDLEMLLRSIVKSFEKIDKLVTSVKDNGVRWGITKNSKLIKSALFKGEKIILKLETASNLVEFNMADIHIDFNKVSESLKEKLAS